MPSTGFMALLVLLFAFALSQSFSFRRNLAAAKKSGLPYVYSPIWPLQPGWLLIQPLLARLPSLLPRRLTQNWLPLSSQSRAWKAGYAPFRDIGHDTFLAVSPARLTLRTCDPAVNAQIYSPARRDDFPKPVEYFTLLKGFGPNLPAAEGREAKLYRRITAPAFGEALHREVWRCSLDFCEGLVRRWGECGGMVEDLGKGMGDVALAVISECCFGRRLEDSVEPGRGYVMSYREALDTAIENILAIITLPSWVLRWSPIRTQKKAGLAYDELCRYLLEMREEEKARIRSGTADGRNFNLLGALVASEVSEAQDKDAFDYSNNRIPPSAVLGNVFIFILAGHETTANALVFAFTLLALHPEIQAKLHAELDQALPSSHRYWSFEENFPALLDGIPGAIMHETLRIYTVLAFAIKSVATDQPLTVDGEDCLIPAGSAVMLDMAATHRHPGYWKCKRSGEPGEAWPYPVSSFDPMRWLQSEQSAGVPEGKRSSRMFRPPAGSYFPFSESSRGCLGKRFAQVEFIAVLARVMKDYNIELAVPDGLESGGLTAARKRAVREMSEGIEYDLTLKMRESVKLRLVKRS